MTSAPAIPRLPGPRDRPVIMGILNLTPDSFSDGGLHEGEAAVAHALRMADEGADAIDVGGESTRPGAQRVEAGEQIRRVVGVIRAVRDAFAQVADASPRPETRSTEPASRSDQDAHPGPLPRSGGKGEGVVISIDTTLAAVAEAALDAGATMLNDVSAGREDPRMLELAAARGVPIVLMHMRGTPATMQADPRYEDVVGEVEAFLLERAEAALAAGVARDRIAIDPGIGFGKTREHNLALLANLSRFVATGFPVLLGTSRKRFMGSICALAGGPGATGGPGAPGAPRPDELVGATCATTALGVAAGVRMFRVHDVRPNRQAADVARAIQGG